jgi:hypothetical protein
MWVLCVSTVFIEPPLQMWHVSLYDLHTAINNLWCVTCGCQKSNTAYVCSLVILHCEAPVGVSEWVRVSEWVSVCACVRACVRSFQEVSTNNKQFVIWKQVKVKQLFSVELSFVICGRNLIVNVMFCCSRKCYQPWPWFCATSRTQLTWRLSFPRRFLRSKNE